MKTPSMALVPCQPVHQVELHYKRPLYSGLVVVHSAEDAIAVLRKCMHPGKIDIQESFWVLYLTHAHGLLGVFRSAEGSTIGTQTNIKGILQTALLLNATSIIVAHNHPSGNVQPSSSDKKTTEALVNVAKLLELTLLDHIILSSESYYSFSQEGQLL